MHTRDKLVATNTTLGNIIKLLKQAIENAQNEINYVSQSTLMIM